MGQDVGEVPLFQVILQIVTAVVITTENVLLIYTLSKNSELHSTSYIFIASLGVTDLVVGLLSFIGSIYYLVLFYPQGGVKSLATTIYICLTTGTTMLSCCHLAVISLERYVYIAYPFFYQRRMTSGFIRNTIFALWVFGGAYLCSLCIAQSQIRYIRVLFECEPVIKLGAVASLYLLSTLVTGLSFWLILRVVHRLRRTASVSRSPDGHVVSRWRVPAKRLKFFISSFGIYIVMTFPAMFDMFSHASIQTPQDIRLVFLYFLISNSGTNFIVLMAVDQKFRVILFREIWNLVSKLSELSRKRPRDEA